MKLIPVYDSDNVRRRTHHNLQNTILEFMESASDTSPVSVDHDEYTYTYSLANGLRRAVKHLNVDILVIQRQGKVYLIKP